MDSNVINQQPLPLHRSVLYAHMTYWRKLCVVYWHSTTKCVVYWHSTKQCVVYWYSTTQFVVYWYSTTQPLHHGVFDQISYYLIFVFSNEIIWILMKLYGHRTWWIARGCGCVQCWRKCSQKTSSNPSSVLRIIANRHLQLACPGKGEREGREAGREAGREQDIREGSSL